MTSLDSVRLITDSQRLKPLQCKGTSSDSPKPYCQDDSDYHLRYEDDVLELDFLLDAQSKAACLKGDVHLEANGYYVPL